MSVDYDFHLHSIIEYTNDKPVYLVRFLASLYNIFSCILISLSNYKLSEFYSAFIIITNLFHKL